MSLCPSLVGLGWCAVLFFFFFCCCCSLGKKGKDAGGFFRSPFFLSVCVGVGVGGERGWVGVGWERRRTNGRFWSRGQGHPICDGEGMCTS